MASEWIETLQTQIRTWEEKYEPTKPASHPNRHTTESVQLKKKLEILWAKLKHPITSYYRPVWYADETNPLAIIATDYDMMLTDIWIHLSYLISLDTYTHLYTKNRGYYCRKKKEIHSYLLSSYNPSLYTFRAAAREYRLQAPNLQRRSLNEVLFYDLFNNDKEDSEDY